MVEIAHSTLLPLLAVAVEQEITLQVTLVVLVVELVVEVLRPPLEVFLVELDLLVKDLRVETAWLLVLHGLVQAVAEPLRSEGLLVKLG